LQFVAIIIIVVVVVVRAKIRKITAREQNLFELNGKERGWNEMK
jgi:hypothetical protein